MSNVIYYMVGGRYDGFQQEAPGTDEPPAILWVGHCRECRSSHAFIDGRQPRPAERYRRDSNPQSTPGRHRYVHADLPTDPSEYREAREVVPAGAAS